MLSRISFHVLYGREVDLEARIKDLENILLKRDQTVQTMHMLNPKPDLFYHPNHKIALGYPNPSYLKKAQLKQQSLYNGNFLLEEHDPPAAYDLEETLELAQERVFVPQTTKSKEELFLSNVSNMVILSKTISIPNEDLSDDTTPSVARKFLNEVKSSLVTLQRVVKQKMTLEVYNWSSSAHKEEADESLDKQKSLELEIERLLKASVSHDIMSIVQNGFVDAPSDLRTEHDQKRKLCIIKKEKEYVVLWNNWYTKCEECKYDMISYDKAYNDMQQKVERLQAQLRDLKGKSSNTPSASNTLDLSNQKLESKIVELEFQVVNYEGEISHLKTTYKNLFDSIKFNRAYAKLHKLVYENVQLRAQLFENTSEPMNNTSGTSSHSVPQPREFNVMKHRNVIAPGMFKINPSQTPSVDLVPNKQSNASIRTNPITNSQRHVTIKENVSFDTITTSSTIFVHTTRTRRPQPKGNTRNARVPSASKRTNEKTISKFNCVSWHVVQICLWCVDSGCSKHITENIKLLINLVWKFLGTVRFGNDHIAAILGYVGQFCDADLEVAFWRNTCFIRDLDGVDLLKGNRFTNIYTINLYDMASASPICLMARVTPTKSWLWHQRLSYLNFNTINDRAKNDLVSGLPKFKYAKEHLCPSCEQGKSKRASHPPKPVPNSKQRLHLLHMDLCGPMRVAIINGKRYHLVIVDDYSRYTWFLFSKQRMKRQNAGITHETSATKTPKQNGVVERKNRTLVEAARTMLIFSHALLFLWAKAIATAVYNRRTKKIMETMNITFDELSAMAFEQNSSRPEASRTINVAPVVQNLHASTASLSCQDSAPVPTNSSNTPVSSHNVDATSLQHAQQQSNHTPSPTTSAADNVPNSVFEGNLFVNPFATPSTYIMELKSVKKALTDPAWIESMQEELHQFIRLYVWELVLSPDGIKPLTLKCCSNGSYQDILGIRCTQRIHSVSTDMKTAFLHGSLKEDVYVCQPKGFINANYPSHAYELKKALYGLKQAPRACGIFINPSKYVHEILKKYGLNTCDIVGAPIDIKDKLDLDMIGTLVDATKYRSMIVALMYLTSSRLDIVHATCVCARYQAHLTEKHLKEVKRIFRYLRGTVNMRLWYTKDYGFEVTGFLDVDYSGCKDTFKSTSESEYVSLSACCAQVLWMRTQLTDYGYHFDKILIYCDSKLAIAISCNPIQHSRTKHIAARYYFIKEHVEKGTIELYFVKTDYQLADIFTEGLPMDIFNYLVRRLVTMEILLEPTSNKLLVGNVGDSIWIGLMILDINLGLE
nr:hypothetical protein [Tanacetum cinerariifolium]